jgi:predicted nucleic acid-binding protein
VKAAVVNASPLILLCKVGREALLQELCGSVVVPAGVVAEIRRHPDDPAAQRLPALTWLQTVSAQVPDCVKAWDLGTGESEVIGFALAHPEFRPILDDKAGKACASSLGLSPLGTAGLLILAKKAGLLVSVSSVLEDMRTEGLWLSQDVFDTICRLAGENV